MAVEMGDQRLAFRLDADEPFELDQLGEGFAGLARQYERMLATDGINPTTVPAKLYITKIRSGSLSFELGASLLALYGTAHALADGAVVFSDFYNRLKRYLDYFTRKGERPPDLSHTDAADFDAFLRTIAGKRGAKLRVRRALFRRETNRTKVLAAFEFDSQDLATAGAVIAHELGQAADEASKPDTKHRIERNVPFIWHRTDREKGRARGATSDRGIIAKVTDKPLPVFFPSESDETKQRMTKIAKNPFSTVYIVDALVEYDDDDEAVSYTITDIKKIV